MKKTVKFSEVKERIITIRNQQVILDSEVAALYDVETKRINEAVSNNPEKFPDKYVLTLTSDEWKEMKSKFSTSLTAGG
ncbi:MAG: ORF6N domain-containing protein, partial [Prevotellaceae bacterium]|nr:ORF6N domain-containing protein [Prevotellaceae bacterium]